jgi:hypothetical protein
MPKRTSRFIFLYHLKIMREKMDSKTTVAAGKGVGIMIFKKNIKYHK